MPLRWHKPPCVTAPQKDKPPLPALRHSLEGGDLVSRKGSFCGTLWRSAQSVTEPCVGTDATVVAYSHTRVRWIKGADARARAARREYCSGQPIVRPLTGASIEAESLGRHPSVVMPVRGLPEASRVAY
jgi:hypothetical protein